MKSTSIQSVLIFASAGTTQYIPSNITTTGVKLFGILIDPELASTSTNSINFIDNKSDQTLFTFKRSPTNLNSPSSLTRITLPSNGIRFSGGIKITFTSASDFDAMTILYQV
jgi:hypothetical protein